MTEAYLHTLPIDDLLNLLTENMDELFSTQKNKADKIAIKTMQKKVQLIQRVIISKRAEF